MATETVEPDRSVIDDAHVPLAESRKVHKPFVPASKWLPEFTPRAVLVGSGLGIIFGAASLYISLKTGLTVSASIPIAVMSISIFRALGRTSILENNISQTTGSAGESVAAGISFTIPGLLVLGYDLEIWPTTIIALLGGWLGVLLMIPLRRALIVKEHGKLLYPEGTACAEVLVVGEKGGSDAKTVFAGLGFAFVYRFLMSGARLWNEAPGYVIKGYQGATVSASITPELLGVGYIIGPRIAAMMLGGGFLSALVLIPTIKFFGAGFTQPLFPAQPGSPLISAMSSGEVQDLYIRYIAAGAVATGGIISLARSLPTIFNAFKSSVGKFSKGNGDGKSSVPRTERDLPMTFVLGGITVLALTIFIWLTVAGAPTSGVVMNIISVLLVLVFGFFFATVSSRITGEMGSSSNPISGMTIATILMTSLLFLLLGKGGADSRVLALSIGAIVCIAASNAGTTSQDLKTGFLVGGTPSRMQWGLMIGVTTSALVIAWTMTFLNDSYSNLLPRNYPSYRAEANSNQEQWTKGDMRGGQLTGGPFYLHRISVDEKGSDGATIPSGKYLTDASGEIQYRINPGINGVRTALSTEKLPTQPIPPPAADGSTPNVEERRVRGLDGNLYHSRSIKEGEKTRTFYVDDAGIAKYEEVTTGPESKFDAPKAQLMAILVDGVLTQKLPWALILIGVFISILLEIVGISALPFAVGMYLPFSTSATIFVGGAVRTLVQRATKGKRTATEEESGPGVLYSSGLIAGSAVAGLLIAIPQGFGKEKMIDLVQYLPAWFENNNLTALVMFGLLVATLYYVGRYGLSGGHKKKSPPS